MLSLLLHFKADFTLGGMIFPERIRLKQLSHVRAEKYSDVPSNKPVLNPNDKNQISKYERKFCVWWSKTVIV